jgi:hypothetical protein
MEDAAHGFIVEWESSYESFTLEQRERSMDAGTRARHAFGCAGVAGLGCL